MNAGLVGFERTYTPNEKIAKSVKEKMDNLIHLIQQSPKIYGLQRVSWTTTELAEVYTGIWRGDVSGFGIQIPD